jgi:hypothetical protein
MRRASRQGRADRQGERGKRGVEERYQWCTTEAREVEKGGQRREVEKGGQRREVSAVNTRAWGH